MNSKPLLTKPVQIQGHHTAREFQSGEPTLDDWLRRRARANDANMASKTYVTTEVGQDEIVGYFCLSMGQVLASEVPGSMRRNMPTHIPCVTIGRLAIDQGFQGSGLGGRLLKGAVMIAAQASEHVAARLVLVHALSPQAEAFYTNFGFTRLPVESPTLALDLKKLKALQ